MIVLDSSAVVELLVENSELGRQARQALALDTDWVMPAHGPTEAANALRGLWLGKRSDDSTFDGHLALLARVEVATYPIAPMLGRIRELASNATMYDAAYLALAETLDAPLVTADRKFQRVPGVRADVRVITAG